MCDDINYRTLDEPNDRYQKLNVWEWSGEKSLISRGIKKSFQMSIPLHCLRILERLMKSVVASKVVIRLSPQSSTIFRIIYLWILDDVGHNSDGDAADIRFSLL